MMSRDGVPGSDFTATQSSPFWIMSSLIVTSLSLTGSTPSVLRAVAGELISTPQTVSPNPFWMYTWYIGEFSSSTW